MKYTLILFALFLVSCASITSGTTQTLTVNTTPDGASCALIREGIVIGRISPTPGSVLVKKDKHDITVECEKAGYQKATFLNKSGIQDATWGNIVLGGGIGWAIDSAAGADNKYTEVMNISLTK